MNINLNFDFESPELGKLGSDKLAGKTPDIATDPDSTSLKPGTVDDATSGEIPANQTEELDLSNVPGSEKPSALKDGSSVLPTNKDIPDSSSPKLASDLSKPATDTLDISTDTSESKPGKDSLLTKDGKKENFDIDLDPTKQKDSDKKAPSVGQGSSSGGRAGGGDGGGGGSQQSSLSTSTGDLGDVGKGLDLEGGKFSSEVGETGDIKVIGTNITNALSQDSSEIDIDDFSQSLKLTGLRTVDINRVLSGEITIEDLMKEIASDSDNTRRQEIMQATYLKAYGIDFTNLDDFDLKIESMKSELATLVDQRKQINSDREIDAMIDIVTDLKYGKSLNDSLKNRIVAWQYTDEEGNIVISYDNNNSDYVYTPITYEELFPYSELLNNLKSFFIENGIDPSIDMGASADRDITDAYFENIYTQYGNKANYRETKLKTLDEKIKKMHSEVSTFQYIYTTIGNEIAYYMKNVDAYLNLEGFEYNSKFNTNSLEVIDAIKIKYDDDGFIYGEDMGFKSEHINDKTDLTKLIGCMINGEGNITNGTLLVGPYAIEILSNDDILRHFQEWSFFITAEEKAVFNFKFNTQGTDAAYQYLEDISDELDNRWLANKTREDQEFAEKYPFLASVASIIVTPFEGISAACFSLNAIANKEKIRRSDVYSSGIVWRAEVAQVIAVKYGGTLSFVYSTGMSMADTGLLLAVSAATGGIATPVFSALLMGSRSYVATLNDALDRGLSDKEAVLLAGVSAVVETAMESLSVGHLLNLEKNLGKTVAKLTGKIASNIKNETLAKIITKGFYIAASSISQGIAEGEEEFTTEVVNYLADFLIAGELSKYSQSIEKYVEYGYTGDQALIATMKDLGSDAFQAFLGGFVSGICFGAFGGIRSTIKISNNIASGLYGEFKGLTPAQAFATVIDINQNNNNVFDNINLNKLNLEQFTKLLSKIRNYSDLDLPNGFASVDDYKKAFIRKLIDSKKLKSYDNNYMLELIKDPIMIAELIGTSKFDNFLISNLKEIPEKIVPALSSLSLENFNRLISTSIMENYIKTLNPIELVNILSNFNQNAGFWLNNGTILNTITNYGTADFYTFVDKFKYYNGEITDFIKTTIDVSNYLNFLDTILTKFYTKEILLNNVSYLDAYQNLLPRMWEIINEDVKTTNWKFSDVAKSAKNSIFDALKKSSNIQLIGTSSSWTIKVAKENEYYDITLEIDGKIQKITAKQQFGEIDLEYRLMKNQAIVDAALNGVLKIKSIEVNQNKSNLVLKGSDGLEIFLNEVVVLLDGVERKIIVNSTSTSQNLDLNFNYYEEFSKYKDIQIKSITPSPLGNKDVVVSDSSALYVVSYKVGDQTYEAFLKPSYNTILPINDYICENSLFEISDIAVSVATKEQITSKTLPIKQYDAVSDIFTDNKYGGNQSDVPKLLSTYLKKKRLSPIDKQKALTLNNLLDKYFPNTTDIDKIKISRVYEEGGCVWMAVSNAFATYMGSIKDGANIFLKKIGYDLVAKNEQVTSYNVEAIAFDMYLSYFSNLFSGNAVNLLKSGSEAGVSSASFQKMIAQFFIDRGINIKSDTEKTSLSEKNLSNEVFSRILNNKGFSILVAKNFDMQYATVSNATNISMDKALEKAKKDGKIIKGVGPHAMLITGIKENMDIEVSSWSDKYNVSLKNIIDYISNGEESNASVYKIDFSIPTDETVPATGFNISGTSTETANSVFSNIFSKTPNRIDPKIVNALSNIIDTIDGIHRAEPNRSDAGLDALESYINNGNEKLITRFNGCRDYVTSLPKETIREALKVIKERGARSSNNSQPPTVKESTRTSFVVRRSVKDVNEATIDPLKSNETLSAIEKVVNTGDNVSDKLISMSSINTPKATPSMTMINDFYNRFPQSKYYYPEENKHFSHICSKNFIISNVQKKLYIDNQNLSDSLTFARMFAEKCEKNRIPFYFKIANMKNGLENMAPLSLLRDESIVIYSSEEHLAQYVNICNEIKNETNMKILKPPILAGTIDGFIGYGFEGQESNFSYNAIRTALVMDAVYYTNMELVNKYSGIDIKAILASIRQDQQQYSQYLNSIRNFIKNNAISRKIDPNYFFLGFD